MLTLESVRIGLKRGLLALTGKGLQRNATGLSTCSLARIQSLYSALRSPKETNNTIPVSLDGLMKSLEDNLTPEVHIPRELVLQVEEMPLMSELKTLGKSMWLLGTKALVNDSMMASLR